MKKNYLVILTLLTVISISLISAETIPKEFINEFVDEYNKNIDQAPKIFKSMFGNERINLYIDEQLFYGFRTENGKIVETFENGTEEPTMNIYVTQEALEQMAAGQLDPGEALKQGKIRYEGVGFFKKIKYGILKIVSGWFM
ncbi:MAG: SCP2 sterol-binding domain-containing protein [Candidatus Nanoarchaeia archaeon]